MNKLRVIVPSEIKQQIWSQAQFIARHSIQNALDWESRFRFAMSNLSESHSHAVDEDASRRLGQPLRKMVFERTYLIHYRVNESAKTVEIVGFRHGARLPDRGEP